MGKNTCVNNPTRIHNVKSWNGPKWECFCFAIICFSQQGDSVFTIVFKISTITMATVAHSEWKQAHNPIPTHLGKAHIFLFDVADITCMIKYDKYALYVIIEKEMMHKLIHSFNLILFLSSPYCLVLLGWLLSSLSCWKGCLKPWINIAAWADPVPSYLDICNRSTFEKGQRVFSTGKKIRKRGGLSVIETHS